MTSLRTWVPDVLEGFEQTTLMQPRSYDGDVEVVLVRRRHPAGTAVAGVLYVHGFVDHFFQTHLADFYDHHGLRFYAVDLRRHGRSLRPHQLPCDIHDIDELLADLDAAIDVVTSEEGVDWLLVNGHSTGGLVAALHAHRGRRREAVSAVFLNSPFLDMNLPAWQERLAEPLLAALGRVAPGVRLPGLSSVYGESLHADHRGAWQYDVAWKPIEAFRPTPAGSAPSIVPRRRSPPACRCGCRSWCCTRHGAPGPLRARRPARAPTGRTSGIAPTPSSTWPTWCGWHRGSAPMSSAAR